MKLKLTEIVIKLHEDKQTLWKINTGLKKKLDNGTSKLYSLLDKELEHGDLHLKNIKGYNRYRKVLKALEASLNNSKGVISSRGVLSNAIQTQSQKHIKMMSIASILYKKELSAFSNAIMGDEKIGNNLKRMYLRDVNKLSTKVISAQKNLLNTWVDAEKLRNNASAIYAT